MQFAWDEHKDAVNRKKHGISFALAARAFDDPSAVSYVERVIEGETRWQTIGLVGNVILVLVAHTVEDNHEETIRIFSARKANRREQAIYFDAQQE